MTRRRFLYRFAQGMLLLLLLPVLNGCDKQEPAEPTLKVDITRYWLGKDRDNRVGIRFEVNTDWRVEVRYAGQDRGWLYVTPGSGHAGENSLTVTTTAVNTSGAVRTAYVDIEYASCTCRLSITQEG